MKYTEIYNNIIEKFKLFESKADAIKQKIASLDINLEPYDDLRVINIEGIKLEYEVMDDSVYIEHIGVPIDMRSKGFAKALLIKFLSATDKKGVPVTLMVYPTDKETTEEKLISMYKKLGFTVTGKDSGNEKPLMKRNPK